MMLMLLTGLAVMLAACSLGDKTPPTPTQLAQALTTATPAELPDLMIRDIRLGYNAGAETPCSIQSNALQLHLIIANRGETASGEFAIEVNGETQRVPAGLAAGQSLELNFPVQSSDVRVSVDSARQVQERDEGNNQAVRFLPTPGLPLECQPTPTPVIAYQGADHILEGHTGKVTSVAFSPDGNLVASGSTDNTLRLWLATEARPLRTMQGHTFPILEVRFSPNGATLATGSMDGLIRLWQVNNGSLVRVLKGHAGWITGLDFSYDGKLLVSSAEDFTVRLWRLPAGSLVTTIDEGMASVARVHFAPNDKLLAWGEADGTVRLWTLTGEWLYVLKDGSHAALCTAFSPDNRLLAVGYDDGTIRIWQIADGSLMQVLIGHSQGVTDLAFSQDNTWLVSASKDGTVRLWQENGASGLLTLPTIIYSGHKGAVNSVDISSKGNDIVSGGDDGTVRLWALPVIKK